MASKRTHSLLPGVMLGCLLLAACSTRTSTSQPAVPPPYSPSSSLFPDTVPVPAQPAEAVPQVPRSAQPPRQLADGSQVPAVKGLIAAADNALARGDVELAAVNLERAQRLAPQSAQVYQKLAILRLRQKRPAEAEQMARKALAYAGGASQQAELWRLIARAREAQGQHARAQEARARAEALQAVGP